MHPVTSDTAASSRNGEAINSPPPSSVAVRRRGGLHEAGEGRCADDGVILLQVCGEQGEVCLLYTSRCV